MNNKIGISTACFYPMPLEDAFDCICNLDVKFCEIFINTISETKIDFLIDIKSKADDNGIKIVSVHPFFSGYEEFLFFSEYNRRTADSIDLYKQFFEAAQYLQSDYVIFHGTARSNLNFKPEKYAETFRLINAEAKKYGVELLQEKVTFLSENFIQSLHEVAPDIRFTLDFKHTLLGGGDIAETIDIMGENIAHIHFNDMCFPANERHTCRLPFYGNINYTEIFNKLIDINYIGCFIIEVYRNNYENYAEIAESIKRFKAFLTQSV